MSGYDLAVWCSDQAITAAYAREFYEKVGSRWISVQEAPQFDAFFRELLAKYPNLGGRGDELEHAYDVPDWLLRTYDGDDETIAPTPPPAGWPNSNEDDEHSAWASTVVPLGCMVGLSASWDRIEEIVPAVLNLAARHGLVVYDAQQNKVHLPERLRAASPSNPRPLLVLTIAGKRPAVDVRIGLASKEIVHKVLPSRRVAHSQARALALKNHLPLYEVRDPTTIGQDEPQPISLDDPSAPPPIKDAIAAARRNGAREIVLARGHSGTFRLTITQKDGTRVTMSAAGSPPSKRQ